MFVGAANPVHALDSLRLCYSTGIVNTLRFAVLIKVKAHYARLSYLRTRQL